jgi:hypothetical protein
MHGIVKPKTKGERCVSRSLKTKEIYMTEAERASRFVDSLLHKTHMAYQRQELAKDKASTGENGLPCPEQRGCKRQIGVSERKAKEQFQLHWFTHLRPNFWKGYFDTLMYMAK